MPILQQVDKIAIENILAVTVGDIATIALCSLNGNILHLMNGPDRDFFILTREEKANLVSQMGMVEAVAYEVV